jgi:hypothetical protein
MSRITTTQIGAGITRHTRQSIVLEVRDETFAEEAVAAFSSLSDRLQKPWSILTPAISDLRARWIQLQRELPDPAKNFDAYHRHFIERQSEPWYVRTAVKLAAAAEKAIVDADYGNALRFAYELGDLMCEYGMNARWGRLAEQGEVAQRYRQHGAAARRIQPAAVRIEAVRRHLSDGKKVGRAIELAAKELACGVSTIKRDFYAYRAQEREEK